jgi:hypothetical protein
MLSKTDASFGAPGSKRLACDFSAMKGARARRVKITRISPFIQAVSSRHKKDFSRAATSKNLINIKLCWIEDMRGAFCELTIRRQVNQMRPSVRISRRSTRRSSSKSLRLKRVAADFPSDLFLFYLTRGAVFDNRHGLFEKLDGARMAKTLSAMKPLL